MKSTRNLTLSGLFLALGVALPFLIMHVSQLGEALLPMHIPVLLCGFVCGWPWGLAVGFITPLLNSVLTGMPPLAYGLVMAFELAAYGALSGLLYRLLPKTAPCLYLALLGAMLGGRIIWGLAMLVFTGGQFGFQGFLAGAFVTAALGIVIQIVLIPILILALRRTKLMPGEMQA